MKLYPNSRNPKQPMTADEIIARAHSMLKTAGAAMSGCELGNAVGYKAISPILKNEVDMGRLIRVGRGQTAMYSLPIPVEAI